MNWALANGYKEGLTIERIDKDKNYCPQNCEWVTRSENSRRRNLQYDYSKRKPQNRFRFIIQKDGEILSIREYAEKNDLVYNTFRSKLRGRGRFVKEEDIDSTKPQDVMWLG